MKNILIISILSCVFSCTQKVHDNKTLQKYKFNSDSCSVVFAEFDYPKALKAMSKRDYRCNDTSFLERFPALRGVGHRMAFQDKNYLLLDIQDTKVAIYTKLLWDKRRDMLICFSIPSSDGDFAPDNICMVTFLTKDLLPTHLIMCPPFIRLNGETFFDKLVLLKGGTKEIKNQHLILKGEMLPRLAKMSYNDLLKFDSLFKNSRYRVSDSVKCSIDVYDWLGYTLEDD